MKKHSLYLSSIYYSEEELEENCHLFSELDWIDISVHQNLSENFIEKYKDKLNWASISFFQNLSDNFINKNKTNLDIHLLLLSPNISESIKREISLLKEII